MLRISSLKRFLGIFFNYGFIGKVQYEYLIKGPQCLCFFLFFFAVVCFISQDIVNQTCNKKKIQQNLDKIKLVS